MTDDTINDQFTQIFDRFLTKFQTGDDGRKFWPQLFYAAPIGYRPLTFNLTVPPGEGPHPLVVYIHGGAWMLGHPDIEHPILEGMDITDTLVRAGYAVARITYRLSSEGTFPMQLHDCKAAVRYLRHHADRLGLDPNRFAAMGESAGAHLALLLGFVEGVPELEGEIGVTGVSSAVSCVVDWYGPTQLYAMDEGRVPEATLMHGAADSPEALLLGGAIQTVLEKARMASPTTHVSANSPPVIIQHGTNDPIVAYRQAEMLAERLSEAGVAHEVHAVDKAGHCFDGIDPAPVLPRTLAFLEKHL